MNERLLALQNPWWKDGEWRIPSIPRVLLPRVCSWLDREEIIVVRGPRRAGKTYLLYQVIEWLLRRGVRPSDLRYFSLDDEDLRVWISEAPKRFIGSLFAGATPDRKRYVFLDEFQKARNAPELIKLLHDAPTSIQFVLSGSSSLQVSEQVSESLLGRTISFLLYPLSFGEVLSPALAQHALVPEGALHDLQEGLRGFLLEPNGERFDALKEMYNAALPLLGDVDAQLGLYLLRGGYPRLRTEEAESAFMLLREIRDSIIEKDILRDVRIAQIDAYRRTMGALAYVIGSLLNVSNLANDVAVSVPTLQRFLNILQQTYIIDLLPVYSTNRISSLKKARKVYFNDTGFRNLVAGTIDADLLSKEKGPIAENFVFVQLKKWVGYALNGFPELYFWRSRDKNEIDFIFQFRHNLLPIEVKWKGKAHRGMITFLEKMGLPAGIVVSWDRMELEPRGDTTIFYVPLALFGMLV